MKLIDIAANGIADRVDRDTVFVRHYSLNGGSILVIAIPTEIANDLEIATGDVVCGTREEDENGFWTLTSISGVNGLTGNRIGNRPAAREKRGSYERVKPNRLVVLQADIDDNTGEMIDQSAPFAIGYAGIVYGPHGSGLSCTLEAVVRGVTIHATEIIVIVLIMRGRGEEATVWRRKYPRAEVIVAPATDFGASSEEALRCANLVLACAKRLTELGHDVLLAVDSLTGLWAAMLEVEEADAQREADMSAARQSLRDWLHSAGDFSGEGLFGSGLGGSLTIVGTVWHVPRDLSDEEIEWEGELHPHLRLVEHALPECDWQVALSGEMAQERKFPAIDVLRCYSREESALLSEEQLKLNVQFRLKYVADKPVIVCPDRDDSSEALALLRGL